MTYHYILYVEVLGSQSLYLEFLLYGPWHTNMVLASLRRVVIVEIPRACEDLRITKLPFFEPDIREMLSQMVSLKTLCT